MLDSYNTKHDVVVVTEFAQGELYQILQDDRTLPEDQVYVLLTISIICIWFLCSTNEVILYYYRQDLPEGQLCRYCFYSRADFRVFRPSGATRCTDKGEIWHGGANRRSAPPCQISP